MLDYDAVADASGLPSKTRSSRVGSETPACSAVFHGTQLALSSP
jgi:hypothetical protein